MNLLRAVQAGLRVGSRDFAAYWTWGTWFGAWLMMLTTNAVMWVMLGRLLGSPSRLDYLLVGFAATAGVGTATIQATTWDRGEGVLALQVAAPFGLTAATFGRAGFWVIGWIPSSLMTFVLLALVFQWRCSLEAAALLPFMVAAICFGACGLTAFLGALIAGIPTIRNVLGALFTTGVIAFCGVSVPISVWPPWVQVIASCLPITHGLEALRILLAHGPTLDVARGVALEVLVGAIWLALAIMTFRRFAEHGRRDGSIDFQENG